MCADALNESDVRRARLRVVLLFELFPCTNSPRVDADLKHDPEN